MVVVLYGHVCAWIFVFLVLVRPGSAIWGIPRTVGGQQDFEDKTLLAAMRVLMDP